MSITSPNATTFGTYVLPNLYQGPGVGYEAAEPHNVIGTGGPAYTWVTVAPSYP